ncbi:uncharacterized protein A1O9_01532 [Exophiala aquamarina CBS 119918]|uniref:Uncharacterized protein n=1 Tax=Exophiala aquamarina CBS 119918 TaxID=1182545 RepID=A0A072PTV8_9EURO|nr:uncharacterized protein A1O9_01532 [Exophiala aquamarina CBS 119918]KEF63554.1 hypothetical protein A1O9_01532 [Exophiala aquamarina CBS 119918]
MPDQPDTRMTGEPAILMHGLPFSALPAQALIFAADETDTLMHRQPIISMLGQADILMSGSPPTFRSDQPATLMRGLSPYLMPGQAATLMASEPAALIPGAFAPLIPGQFPALMHHQPTTLWPGPSDFMTPGQSDISMPGRPAFSIVGRRVMGGALSEFILNFCETILMTTGNDSAGPSDPPFPQILARLPVQQPVFQFDAALFQPIVTNSPAPAPAQPTWDGSSLIYPHAPTLHPQEVQNIYERCTDLIDLLRTINTHLNEREAQISMSLNEMWAENADIRKRGLMGGIARKQRLRMAYVPVGTTAEGDKARRKAVEKRDKTGRNQLKGVDALRQIFEEGHHTLRRMMADCNVLTTWSEALRA